MARRKQRRTGRRTAQPQVVHPEAAGLDVGATAVYAAVRADRASPAIRNFPTFTVDLHALADWLQESQVTTVAMESTGVYWIPVFQILEARGFEVVLVNARLVRSAPGRKSDVADCEWLRHLHSAGLLRGSFRPPDEVCALRTLLRHRDTLVKAASRSVLHMQKSYDQMNIHVHHAISDLTGVTGMAITDAILAGERDPARLAALADRRIKASRDTLIKALQGDWRPEHLFTLQQARQTHAHYQQLIDTCDQQIQAAIRALQRPPEEPANAPSASAGGASEAAGEGEPPSSPSTPEPEPFVLRVHLTRLFGTDLTLIPGIGESTALTLFAEIGADMSRFPDAAHLASWLNLCPQNKITGGRVISSKTGPASNRAAQALRMATQSLYRSQTSLGDYFRRKRARLGTPQAITASAHKMARIIYHLVTHHVLYDDDVLFRQQHRDRKRRERNLRHQARALGFDLVPQAA